jgi:hypothetical protein
MISTRSCCLSFEKKSFTHGQYSFKGLSKTTKNSSSSLKKTKDRPRLECSNSKFNFYRSFTLASKPLYFFESLRDKLHFSLELSTQTTQKKKFREGGTKKRNLGTKKTVLRPSFLFFSRRNTQKRGKKKLSEASFFGCHIISRLRRSQLSREGEITTRPTMTTTRDGRKVSQTTTDVFLLKSGRQIARFFFHAREREMMECAFDRFPAPPTKRRMD